MPASKTETSHWFDQPPQLPGEGTTSSWHEKFREASWERFKALPIPSRKDENWRYADLKKSRFEQLYPVQSETEPYTIEEEPPIEGASAWFRYVNGELIDCETNDLSDDVLVVQIEEEMASEGRNSLESRLDVDAARLGGEKFAALHGSASNYGLFIKADHGTEVAGPIVIQHFITGELAPVFPRTVVVSEKNANVSVIEQFKSVDDEVPGLSIGVCDLYANDGGKIRHTVVQNLNTSSKQVHLATSNAGKDASVQSVIVNLGGAWIRNESINQMTETGANTRLYGVNLANENQEIDQRTLQVHDAEHTTSDLLIKNALYEKSRAVFGGLIQVLPGAHHTDSYQSCRTLLGSDEAEMNAMPGLEIDADQVRCSHGATSGQISEDEIFYLQTRGIPAEEAKRMVSCGFLREALGKIGDPKLVEWLGDMIEEKFDRIGE